MIQNNDAVAGKPGIAFETRGAKAKRQLERIECVFWGVGAGTSMGEANCRLP